MHITDELSKVSERVEAALAAEYSVVDADFSVLQEAELYSLMAGGKRIRPFLVIKACELFGGDSEMVMPLAVALEMVHTYSLIHDDLPCMDNDDLRRGKPTCHKQYGEANALLAGDAMLTAAFRAISRAEALPPELRVRAILLLAEAAGDRGMLAGQVMDAYAETHSISYEQLLKLHRKKTGALISVAVELGALGAGLSESDPGFKAILEYSENIGIAFQVIDDLLDATGSEAELGKPIGSDRESGKTTFLSFMSVEEAERYAVELTENAVSAIADYDRDGVFTALAYFLCNRRH